MIAARAAADKGPLAMLCGGGSLPIAVADKVMAGGRPVLLFPLRDAAEEGAIERFPHHWLHIGQIGKFLRLARAAGCKEVVFIGSLVRPSLWRIHLDLKGLRFFRGPLRPIAAATIIFCQAWRCSRMKVSHLVARTRLRRIS